MLRRTALPFPAAQPARKKQPRNWQRMAKNAVIERGRFPEMVLTQLS